MNAIHLTITPLRCIEVIEGKVSNVSQEMQTFLAELEDSAIIYMPGQRPAIEVEQNFAFVLNISEIEGGIDVSLADGHQLRKATRKEVSAIKDVLTNNTVRPSWHLWECDPTPVPTVDGGTTWKMLPEEDWRYYVVPFEGSNSTLVEIERTLCIAPLELKIAFTIMREVFPGHKTPTLIYSPPRLFFQLRSMAEATLPAVKITEDNVKAIRQLCEKIKTDSNVSNLKSSIRQISDLEGLPHKSPLLFLGYFAILESLLTHKVKETDTTDSITRQVKQKVILLDNRWQPRIDYSPFPGTTPNNIWSLMYGYRSALAHGDTPDFAKALRVLGNHDRALALLKQTVRSVLRQALDEPQLLLDLRNC